MVNGLEHLPATASQASTASMDTSHASVSYIQPAEDPPTSELSSMDEKHFTGVSTNQISLAQTLEGLDGCHQPLPAHQLPTYSHLQL